MKTTTLKTERKVGDIHTNGIWVWKEYKTGKFDWRVISDKAPKAEPIDETVLLLQYRNCVKNLKAAETTRKQNVIKNQMLVIEDTLSAAGFSIKKQGFLIKLVSNK